MSLGQWVVGAGLALVGGAHAVGVQEPANELDFERDVLPILREHCFDCHGPYRQKAGLRLDQRAAAMAGSSFGTDPVLVPGNRDASLLWDMISSPDEDDRMPPAKSPPLGADQIQLLGAWIDAGATWPDDGHAASWPSKHWSYQTPQSVEPPGLDVFPKRLRAWPQGEVDRFLLAAMLTAGLEPQPLADRALWFRRASLDLTGLPPSLPELDEFLGDSAPDAWERALDRLMDSPHYGEQQALRWLDLARYADSNGYEKDAERSIWPYRDWVIEAYNQDLGFDEFTRLQLAGDLLPDGGQQALIATGFQRNTMVNDEGGTDAEEYRVAAVKDRTDTLAAVWLGSTMGCAQCHNHKYDPFTQRDYYQLYAFFDQTADGGKSNEPILPVETPALLAERARALAELASFQAGRSLPQSQDSIWVGESIPEAQIVDGDWSSEPLGERRRGGAGYQQIYFTGAKRPFVVLEGDCWFVDVWVDPESPAREILIQFHVQAGNWEHRAYLGEDLHGLGRAGTGSRRALGSMPAAGAWHRIEIQPELVDLPPGSQVDGFALGQVDGFVRWGNAGLTTTNPDPSEPLPPEAAAAASTLARTVTTLVMRAVDSPRTTHLLERGSFLSPGAEVQPEVPVVLRAKGQHVEPDRLGLANWLVDPEQPLTARVEVNRVWQQIFGTGIVATLDDFGSQGEPPSHPELLDWLATEFVSHGWSRKWLLRTLMTSAAYRQGAEQTDANLRIDPTNRLLAHFPRLRLPAENLRDLCLAVSQRLESKVGGPSVHPPQPAGIDAGTYTGDRWFNSTGPDRYRRGLYTFWRRTSPYPSFVLFDATSRELACTRRNRSNTPLQALALLNDPAFVETTRAFAERLEQFPAPDDADRIRMGFRACTGRFPNAHELEVLMALRSSAGWESLARVLLNLDETLNRG